jgi:hypothetical protein
MKHLLILLVLTAGVASCTRTETYPLGTDVTVVRNDGSSVSGRLIEVKQDRLVVQRRDGGNSAESHRRSKASGDSRKRAARGASRAARDRGTYSSTGRGTAARFSEEPASRGCCEGDANNATEAFRRSAIGERRSPVAAGGICRRCRSDPASASSTAAA